ncbi:hypothetical protein [Actinocorallia populi]|uniref:hypothetical protein n=1 Tax=Actinocorallia populi TaxID=2079200 RepID=UPI000D093F08|nr:hypothetical protein [Actinocorallia populi]
METAGADQAADEKRRQARERTAERRARMVDAGVAELAQWLRDQVSRGLAGAERAPHTLWDEAARRLVDAQARALADRVRELAAVPRRGERWPSRLLEEYGLLHLLVRAYQRQDGLPPGLRATVRARIGFTAAREDVLAGPRVRDDWYVLGVHESERDDLRTRRTWLRGLSTGRPALILAYGASSRPLEPVDLPPGTAVDASLAFHPGAPPLRAVAAELHAPPRPAPPPGSTVMDLLDDHAAALSQDPWLDRWPAALASVRLARSDGLHLVDPAGDSLPVKTHDPWRLLSFSGGAPLTLAGEWTPTGLRPLSAWHPTEGLVTLP